MMNDETEEQQKKRVEVEINAGEDSLFQLLITQNFISSAVAMGSLTANPTL